MKTKRNIEYDLAVLETGLKSIKFLATSNYGSEEFTHTYALEVDDNMLRAIDADDFNYLLSCTDTMQAIETWVDSSTISGISHDLAKVCIEKSINGKHYSFSINTLDKVSVTVLECEVYGNGVTILDKFVANGYDEIEYLIEVLKTR